MKLPCKVVYMFCMLCLRPVSLCNAQHLFTEVLQWKTGNAIEQMKCDNDAQLSAWSKRFGVFTSVNSETFQINETHFLVFYIDPCSGVFCPSIYVFREQKDEWQLIVQSTASLTETISIDVNSDLREIVFKTKSALLGTLSFGQLMR